ncbi:hypothetical protein, partial [Lactobacillus crispatus]|uniref:hypothetical protein n=1 Tax=Lactobacillus crispatus TaxID=47770 RepID=UPI003F24D4C4
FFVQTNHTRKELLFLMFKEINLRNHLSLHKLFYSLKKFFISRGINLKSLIEYIVNFFYPIPPNVNGWAPSWYLIAMALGIPVFVAIINSLNRNFIVIGIISMLIEIYYILADEFGFITHLPTWGIWSFPRLFVYIFCGFLIAKYYDKILVVKIRYYLILAIASILIFTCEYAVIESISHNSNLCETITIVPTSFIICCLSIKWMPKVGSTLRIRNFSTFLYCYQWFPLRFLGKVRILHYVSFVNFSVIIVTALILFYVYNKLYKRKGLNFFKYAV